MLPTDPDFVRENISVTHPSLCAPDFRRNVAARDGARCVLTGNSDVCDAAHVVPVGKGDEVCRAARPDTLRLIICPGYFMQYIQQLTSR